jgi:Bbp16-like protein
MILDAQLQFTGAPATGGLVVTGTNYDLPTTGTQNSSNIIDLHMSGIPVLANLQGARDIGVGDDPALKLLIQVITAITGGTSLQVVLQGAPDNGSGAPGSYANWWASPVYAEATLVAGARLYDMDMPRPPAGIGVPRFLRLGYVSAGTHTAGSLGAWIVLDRMDQMYNATANATMGGYPAGVVIAN